MNSKSPTEEQVVDAINGKVSAWLLKECIKIFGEDKMKEVKDIKAFLDAEGYHLNLSNKGMTASCELYHGDKRVSFYNINVMSLALKLANKK